MVQGLPVHAGALHMAYRASSHTCTYSSGQDSQKHQPWGWSSSLSIHTSASHTASRARSHTRM